MENKYEVKVYNTLTGKFESVAVSEAVYRVYGNGKTANRDNDKSFFSHEIQFSALIGGDGEAYENFREFQTLDTNPEEMMCSMYDHWLLTEAVNALPQRQREEIKALYLQGTAYGKVAEKLGISPQAERKRRKAARAALKKYLKKFQF